MDIRDALISANPAALEVAFQNLLSWIPYSIRCSFDGHCQMVLFLAYNSIEQRVELKKATDHRTSKAIVTIEKDVFVMEFKRIKTDEEKDESYEEVAEGRERR
jgi:hypothetical protein